MAWESASFMKEKIKDENKEMLQLCLHKKLTTASDHQQEVTSCTGTEV
uniref:Uncharacterized protein n=1 Tax=Lepeophtheirus salmonis TaxID=72036 RepID=A0A0K2UGP5_LEPSM